MTRGTFATLAVLAFASEVAWAQDWSAVAMRGTVLSLVGDQWKEIEHGMVLNGDLALRTLQSGRLELAGDAATIRIGPNTALELLTGVQGATTLIRQYSGSVTLDAATGAGGRLRLETESLAIVPQGGSVTVVVSSTSSEVTVAGGGVAAVTSTTTGEAVTVGSGAVVASAGSEGLAIAGSKSVPGRAKGVGSPGNAGEAKGDPDSPSSGNPNSGNGNPANANPGNANPGNGNPGNGNSSQGQNDNRGGS